MPYQLMKSLDQEIWIKITGRITPRDLQECQALAELGAEWFHQAKVLIVLDDFQGWSKDDDWSDTSFLPDSEIAKMAVVGDRRWEEEVFLFVGKPMRTTEMRFFSTDQLDEAKDWLAQ
ncbi:STAS/SEC14 domain-containing protein [Methylococcus sp. EFPC2]|uniref:STAS/SEC14 domain-containing protein n=1 Tax=Methylococcus sp. EFPC2 TaxID=2812648 RepID=UPI001967191C|nr:STAS/SEC14 domain-containing protein [Methylococcus sp. EFPC2]QSA97805.1 STAS/SEC14 domain-containing protein [Methylococcus sp. EFPC2]